MNINGTNDAFYRYKMTPMKIRHNTSRKRTYITNLDIISNELGRDIGFIKKYFNKKMSVSVNWRSKSGDLELGGVYKLDELLTVLQEMIDEYVLCIGCGNPETRIRYSKSGGGIKMSCGACGHKGILPDSCEVYNTMLKYLKDK
jgi:translation initiation factor 2 beta subunit (eIF-2beta)/eIF-5